MKQYFRTYLFQILLLVFSVPALYYLITPGFYEPHDLHHLADIYQMARAITSSQFPPRLGPDFTFGFSYPLFNFYYVLPFYIGSLFYFLFGSLTASLKSVFLLSCLLSVFGMYLFLKEFVGKVASLAGAVLFLYTPYRAVQLYVRGAIGEALALALLPYVALFIVKVLKRPKPIYIFCSAIMFSSFILSHNYFFALSTPFLIFLFLLIFPESEDKKNAVSGLIIAAVLSIGLTAYWWLPALIEQGLVASITPFPLVDHFPFIKQLILPSWGYGSSVWGPDDQISFQIGIVNLLAVLASVVIFIFKRSLFKNSRVFIWAIGGFFISIFFMNIRSLPIWKMLPFYNFIQFPWRLLSFTAFFSSILLALVIEALPKARKVLFTTLTLAMATLLTYGYFRPSKIVYKSDSDYLNYFFSDPTYSEDYLLLPKWVGVRPTKKPDHKVEVENGTVEEIKEITPIKWSSRVSLDQNSKVKFNTYYFPGWTASVDGTAVQITSGEPYGQIELSVSEGKHTLEFIWKETKLRRAADIISFISLVATFLLLTEKGKAVFRRSYV